MNFIDKYRQNKEDDFVENATGVMFETICSGAAAQLSADSYTVRYETHFPSAKTAEAVLEAVRLKFLDEDVVAKISYSNKMVHATLETLAEPTVIQISSREFFWSCTPGKFVNKLTGDPVNLASSLSIGPYFTGTIREWYETLIETVIDVSNDLHRQHGASAAKVFVGAGVERIIESSMLYKPVANFGRSNASHIGTLCGFTKGCKIYKNATLPHNVVYVTLDLGDVRHIAKVHVLDM